MNFGEFTKNEFLAKMIGCKEDTATPINNGLEVYGAINIDNDSYITIVKNSVSCLGHDGPRTDQISCRISIIEPKYLQYDELLTKEEKEWFIDFMLRNWDYILEDNYDLYHDYFGDKKYKKLNIHMPNYSNLETLD